MRSIPPLFLMLAVATAGPAAAQEVVPQTYTATYTYDSAGRLTQAAFGPTAELNYQYDAAGNLTAAAPGAPPVDPDTTARARKEAALTLLQPHLDHGDKNVRLKVRKAVKHIGQSLDAELWGDDGNHLNPAKGRKVFDEERHAAKKLRKLLGESEDDRAVLDEAVDALAHLVAADQILASVALAEAEAACATATDPGDTRKCLNNVGKAWREWDKAEEDLANDRPHRAIGKYGHAWGKAQKAIGEASGVGAKALATTSGEDPEVFSLGPNYPNPFNPVTTIEFVLPEAVSVQLMVYDVLGREVARLVDAPLEAGHHRVRFDASRLSSGLYIYRIEAGAFSRARHMLLVK